MSLYTSHRTSRPVYRAPFGLAFFALLSVADIARAQIPPPLLPPSREREGSAEFAFVGTTGNSSTTTIGIGGEYIYRPPPLETRLKVNYVRNEANDEVKAESFVLTFRARRAVTPRVSGYGQYGYQRDRFAGILSRHTAEAGLVFSWIDQARQKLIVDTGLGYAHEERLFGDNLSQATLGSGGTYTLKLSNTSDVSEDAHIIVSLSDKGDWRYVNTAALTAKVTALFNLKLSNVVRFVNQPVVGFRSTDVITSIALVAKF